MQQQGVTIVNKLGLHARAAAKFVSLASQFKCDIHLANGARKVNGKSIMGVLMLAASIGTVLTITTDGIDEEAAMQQLMQLIAQRFEEDE